MSFFQGNAVDFITRALSGVRICSIASRLSVAVFTATQSLGTQIRKL